MCTHKLLLATALLLAAGAARAESPNLGRPVSESDLKAWDISVLGDGTGLPPGSGTPAQGAKVYAEKGCAACHGDGGRGGRNGALVGSPPIDRIEAPKTIANFWGSATTIFDFTRRAMPYVQPQTLTDDEAYALTAFILEQNKIIGTNDVIDARTLPKVKMPNADNFIIRFPDRI
ncbi:MAG: cytochrome c [Xanthobacteraceae bacterium]|nr:cytochrome c [Xanthobacteraceae bacterium]